MSTIISITGGLGNQLFQYAHGLKLSLIDKKKVIFDTSFFTHNTHDTHRPFLLNNFNITPHARFEELPKHGYRKYVKKILHRITGNYGLYQSEKYFIQVKNEVLRQYTLQKPLSSTAQAMAENILAEKNSVSIHIRRGDYVQDRKTHTYHGTCDLQYYRKAIQYMQATISSPYFFIFSDDIAWAKENIHLERVTFVSDAHIPDYEELILMSYCHHHIIANSTFSWWGAYLSTYTDKTVVAPKQWTVKKRSDQLDILPKNWILL